MSHICYFQNLVFFLFIPDGIIFGLISYSLNLSLDIPIPILIVQALYLLTEDDLVIKAIFDKHDRIMHPIQVVRLETEVDEVIELVAYWYQIIVKIDKSMILFSFPIITSIEMKHLILSAVFYALLLIFCTIMSLLCTFIPNISNHILFHSASLTLFLSIPISTLISVLSITLSILIFCIFPLSMLSLIYLFYLPMLTLLCTSISLSQIINGHLKISA